MPPRSWRPQRMSLDGEVYPQDTLAARGCNLERQLGFEEADLSCASRAAAMASSQSANWDASYARRER